MIGKNVNFILVLNKMGIGISPNPLKIAFTY